MYEFGGEQTFGGWHPSFLEEQLPVPSRVFPWSVCASLSADVSQARPGPSVPLA